MNITDEKLNNIEGSRVVIFGSREHIEGDVCFARLDDKLDEMVEDNYPDMHYLLRMVDGVDYDRFFSELYEFFPCFDITYEYKEIVSQGACIVIEVTPKWTMDTHILFAALNVLFCTFRCVDYEFKSYFRGLKEKKFGLFDGVEHYIIKKGGDTNHCLNENLHALWNNKCLLSAIKLFFNTIRSALSTDLSSLIDEPAVKGIYDRRWYRGQTVCYDILEALVECSQKGEIHVNFTDAKKSTD